MVFQGLSVYFCDQNRLENDILSSVVLVLMEALLSIASVIVIAVLLYTIGFAGYCAQRMLCGWVASWPLWRLPLHKIVGFCVLAVAAGLFGRKATNPNDAPPPLMTQDQGSGLTVEGLDEVDGIARTNDFFISHVSRTNSDAPVFMFVQYIQQAMDELYAGYSLLIYDLSIFQGVLSQ